MKHIVFNSLLMFLLVMNFAFASDSKKKEGRELYLQAKCSKCHLSDYKFVNKVKNKANKAGDYESLRGWVSGCNVVFSAEWFDNEVDLVTYYLNSIYYHFKISKKDTKPTKK